MASSSAAPDPRTVLVVAARRDSLAPGGLRIPLDELVWRFSGSGGPGGQHANTSNTRAEVVLDVTTASGIPDAARARLLERLGPTVAVAASDRRSQAQNRDLALERLAERLGAALVVERPRRPTRPSRASVRRRLDAKRRQGERKAERRSGRRHPGDEG